MLGIVCLRNHTMARREFLPYDTPGHIERTEFDDVIDTAILVAGMRMLAGTAYAQQMYETAVSIYPQTAISN